MAKFTNQTVVQMYFQTENHDKTVESHTGNLWITSDGKRLMNYSTCLVERNNELNLIILNKTSYSVTTSKIQSYIAGELWKRFGGEWIFENTITVDNVHMSTSYLYEAAKKKMEWEKGMQSLNIINYFDVWGNKKDGWEINNLCHDGEIQLHETELYNHALILKKLKAVGFLSSHVRMNQLVFDDLHEFGVEIYQKRDMKPICRVEFIHSKEEVK